jgi:hypothetical protein
VRVHVHLCSARLANRWALCLGFVIAAGLAVPGAGAAQPVQDRLLDASSGRESTVVTPAAEARLFDASSGRESTVVTPAAEERLFDASSGRESTVVTPAAEERLFDASSGREGLPVATTTAASGGWGWQDSLVWGGTALAIVAFIGAVLAIWWTSYHHGPRHPRGPAVPTH